MERPSNINSHPPLCANGCGFFGTTATNNMCSKCYVQYLNQQQLLAKPTAAPALVASVEKNRDVAVSASNSSTSTTTTISDQPSVKVKLRCNCCGKRVGLTGFNCRCGHLFCSAHRYSDKHDCTYDYRATGQDAIAKANPVVKAEKLEKI